VIPASDIVSVVPSVLAAGGNPLALIGLILSQYSSLPAGPPLPFPDAPSVEAYFGPTSQEAVMADVYFKGYDGATTRPNQLLFKRFASDPTSAFLRGAGTSLTLAQVQAIKNAVSTSSASIAATTLTIGGISSGSFVAGMLLTGSGVTAGTRIVSQLTGATGGIGTYRIDTSQTVAGPIVITGAYDLTVTIDGSPETFDTIDLSGATSLSDAASEIESALGLASGQVQYSSTFSAFVINSATTGVSSIIGFGSELLATTLKLTAALGAVTSQGTATNDPVTVMDDVIAVTQNWVTFGHAFDATMDQKKGFATWTNAQDGRYAYVPFETDVTAATSTYSGFMAWVKTNNIAGVADVYFSKDKAAFIMGAIASIDFSRPGGQITLKFKSQTGLAADVNDSVSAANLTANGLNYYGAWATANDSFTFLAEGIISGPFKWINSYIGEIWLNNEVQLAFMVLLTTLGKIPYNAAGKAAIRATLGGPVAAGLLNGVIEPGVILSPSQILDINIATGVPTAADSVSRDGYYVFVGDTSPEQRALRNSPPVSLFYTDGGAVHRINVASTDVQ
jgi:hypothetical protein